MNESIARKSINQEKSQLINRALVADLLRQEGVCSRATLAQLSGLKQATITNIIGEFIECGLVVETGLMSGCKGRRSIGITLNDDLYKVIGVRMTRSAFYTSLAGLSGKIYAVKQYKISPKESVQDTITRIRTAIKTIIRENEGANIPAVCMAMPGPYREDRDQLLFVTELAGWQNFPIKEALTKDFDIPIHIVNDANASAFAQLWYRSKDYGIQNMIYVLAGQGVGCGIITNGKLVLGQRGIAGEFGHSTINYKGALCECGNRGCLEKYCSYLVYYENVTRRLRAGESSFLSEDNLTPASLSDAVKNGDQVAREEYEKVCEFLAIGIVNLINQFNPGMIVIGDELAEIDSRLMLSIVKEHVRECINPLIYNDVVIETNALPESPALLGAGAIAAKNVLSDPTKLMKLARSDEY
ncbi:ROK family protein [Clostridium sp. D33t1_170424_F3]|uniref:ROK family protein n=1 Tax=Clostridium sp. D33t1_170424_F3 TaxID=2787099 RepID=UPI0018AB39A8|nr:ROK family protein [Clostridium sp. D33t1_170424_F3]